MEIEQIIPDPDQPRTEFNSEALTALAENLKAKGQLHPLHVRWSETAQRWVIISGERRWRAARHAGLATVDCFFHEEPLSKSQILELQLIENLLREDLSPLEEARAFETLLRLNGWTSKQLAETVRIPASKISRSLALLKLPAEIQDQVEAGAVPARTAYELSKLTNSESQRRLAEDSAEGRLTTSAAARAVRQRQGRSASASRTTQHTFFADGPWRVTISGPKNGTYEELESALLQVLDEVRLRIDNNVRRTA
ncbi:MAG: ParB/RepB/Spo0J family partition protein [Planctomycetaceae bacterium]|nr:ParB/RepB/Spo0J family partition protein [Planctomycetaceae bacterium]